MMGIDPNQPVTWKTWNAGEYKTPWWRLLWFRVLDAWDYCRGKRYGDEDDDDLPPVEGVHGQGGATVPGVGWYDWPTMKRLS